jgi:predicted RNA-binding protein with RPS1 domain
MAAEPVAPKKSSVDVSSFSVGQEFDGKLVSAKNFGVFVDIGGGVNALLPRSLLSRGSYEKLKNLANAKSVDPIKIELTGVSTEDNTISAKYIPANFKERADINSLEGKDLSSASYSGTVISAHDFGVFVELDEFGVEGLVPASKLPKGTDKGNIRSMFEAGSDVTVRIEQLSIGDKKLVLSMNSDSSSSASALHTIAHDKWFQGIVQSVAGFGLFVRPAGFENIGLVHYSRIPKPLMNALKRQQPVDAALNQTDVEQLFSAGDVIKCRIHSAGADSRKIELSMLPYKEDEGEDDYVVEGRDPEGTEDKFDRNQGPNVWASFDSQDTLLWWRGEPYAKVDMSVDPNADPEAAISMESQEIVEGTWRRLFEVDMREDQADFSSKILENELKGLAEEIGELEGIDDDVVDALGFGTPLETRKLGAFVPSASLPQEWVNELEFYKEFDEINSIKLTGLKGGKGAEQAEFESLLREVEAELERPAAPVAVAPDDAALVVSETEGDE